MADVQQTYKYPALTSEASTRVLILEPASSLEHELKAYVSEIRLTEEPKYEAISYTWGQPVFSERLHVGEGVIPITKNLAFALRYFRHLSTERALWADSVCINQQDNDEKGRQVAVMSQIYKKAENVLIWLGTETPETSRAMEFASTIVKDYGYNGATEISIDSSWWKTSPTLKIPLAEANAVLQRANDMHFRDIYSREWFARLWTVQEIVLARNAVVHCGSLSIPWAAIATTVILLEAASNTLSIGVEDPEAFKRACVINDIRWHYKAVEEIPHGVMLSAYQHIGRYMDMLRTQRCSDAHDRIYALLGLRPSLFDLLGETETFFDMKPDYTLHPFELYKKWALGMMFTGDYNFLLSAGLWQRNVRIRNGNMHYLSGTEGFMKGYWFTDEEILDPDNNLGQHSYLSAITSQWQAPEASGATVVDPTIPDLPSWVPDLSNSGRTPYSLPWLNTPGPDGFSAGFKIGHPMRHLDEDLDKERTPDSMRRIFLEGVLLDQIGSIVMIHQWFSDSPGSRLCYLWNMTQSCKQIFNHFVRGSEDGWLISENTDIAFARTIVADGCGIVFQNLFKSAKVVGSSSQMDPNKLLYFWETYERFWKDKDIVAFEDIHSFDDIPSPSTPPHELEIVKSYHNCLIEALEGHMFIATIRRNFFGLAPLAVKSYDHIAIIPSVRTPLVLRSVTDSEGKDGCILVGSCYLHGVMYSSGWAPEAPPVLAKEQFIPMI